MKIKEIEIHNFKSLRHVHIEAIPEVVVIAGPTGVGKSSILEAIIYFKQHAGSYYNSPISEGLQFEGLLDDVGFDMKMLVS